MTALLTKIRNRPIRETVFADPPLTDPFVTEYQMPDTEACSVVIDRANQESRWSPSEVAEEGERGVDTEGRDSLQMGFAAWAPPLEHQPLLQFAQDCLDGYLEKFPQAGVLPPFRIFEAYNLLKYEIGGAYHGIHSDWSPLPVVRHRHLTFVLFLNTVASGGELEFHHQGVRIKPVAGRAVIFPTGWTHAHHSLPADEERYVFQLWWSFNE